MSMSNFNQMQYFYLKILLAENRDTVTMFRQHNYGGNMKELLLYIYLSIVVMLSVYIAILATEAKPKAQLNCAVSEISPDFSHADREKCRLMRANRL
jgi:hypothetical protein